MYTGCSAQPLGILPLGTAELRGMQGHSGKDQHCIHTRIAVRIHANNRHFLLELAVVASYSKLAAVLVPGTARNFHTHQLHCCAVEGSAGTGADLHLS